MRSIRTAVAAAALAGAIGIAGAAHAATVTGTIANVDLATNRITLTNGEIFKLYTPLRASQYQVGQQVQVSWGGQVDGYNSAHDVKVLAQAPAAGTLPVHPTPHVAAPYATTPAPVGQATPGATIPGSAANPQPGGTPVVATISQVDLAENRLVMSNGDIFKLGTGLGASDYRVGQQVRVSWAPGMQGYKEAYRVEPIR